MARPGDELAARLEEPLQAARHLIEGHGERLVLARPSFGHADGEVVRQLTRGLHDSIHTGRDRAREQQRGSDNSAGRARRDDEDRQVVVRLEHDNARDHHRRERQDDGDQRQADELETNRR